MKPKPMKRLAGFFFKVIKIGALALAGLYFMLAFGCQHKLLYYPDKEIEATPQSFGLAYENVWLTTADGTKINAWFIKNPAAVNNETILAFHGNGGNMGDFMPILPPYYELGFNIALIDYRGFGQSEGRPGEQGIYQDAQTAWLWLTQEKNIRPENIYLFGYSLGGGVASHLAGQHPEVAGLILAATFTSLTETAKFHYPWLPVHFILGEQYDSQSQLKNLRIPLLIMHSPDDKIVPYAFGEKLYQEYQGPKTFMVLQGGHGDSFRYTDYGKLAAWFEEHLR